MGFVAFVALTVMAFCVLFLLILFKHEQLQAPYSIYIGAPSGSVMFCGKCSSVDQRDVFMSYTEAMSSAWERHTLWY